VQVSQACSSHRCAALIDVQLSQGIHLQILKMEKKNFGKKIVFGKTSLCPTITRVTDSPSLQVLMFHESTVKCLPSASQDILHHLIVCVESVNSIVRMDDDHSEQPGSMEALSLSQPPTPSRPKRPTRLVFQRSEYA
jgi:hypothetical protein